MQLGLVVSLGSWAIMLVGGDDAWRGVLLLWPLTYAVAAVVLLRTHRRSIGANSDEAVGVA